MNSATHPSHCAIVALLIAVAAAMLHSPSAPHFLFAPHDSPFVRQTGVLSGVSAPLWHAVVLMQAASLHVRKIAASAVLHASIETAPHMLLLHGMATGAALLLNTMHELPFQPRARFAHGIASHCFSPHAGPHEQTADVGVVTVVVLTSAHR